MSTPLRPTGLAVLVGVVALSGLAAGRGEGAALAATDVESPELVEQQSAASARKHTEFFPLPLYAISPSEGSTFGVLPVFLRVDGTGRTTSITAPSVSWNKAAGVSGTFRYYSIARDARAWTLIASASTHVNSSFRFEYRDVPGYPHRYTLEVQALARRNLFYRFFGFGPNTTHEDQSSYTRAMALASVRGGVNVFPCFNVGVRGGVRGDRPEDHTVFDLPSTFMRYPGTPGLSGAALATMELSLRYDTRPQGDYSRSGVASELHGSRDLGFDGGVSLWRATWETRVLVPEATFLTGAARVYWTDQWGGGPNVPFYYQSMLGGDTLFRAFTQDRFIDRGAWEGEVEQRFTVFRTSWFGVAADWRIDPFVAVGQVYPNYSQFASHVRKAAGVGFRAFVHPNILGRVDTAYSSDGFVAFVLMGYPY